MEKIDPIARDEKIEVPLPADLKSSSIPYEEKLPQPPSMAEPSSMPPPGNVNPYPIVPNENINPVPAPPFPEVITEVAYMQEKVSERELETTTPNKLQTSIPEVPAENYPPPPSSAPYPPTVPGLVEMGYTSPKASEQKDKPGLPNSFFGPDSPLDPDPFVNLPKDLLDQAGMKLEESDEDTSKIIPPISPKQQIDAVPHAPNPKLTLADFEAEEALFSR